VESAIWFEVILGSSIRASDSKKLNKQINKAGSVLGTDLKTDLCVKKNAAKAAQHKR